MSSIDRSGLKIKIVFILQTLVPMVLFLFLAMVDEHNIIMEDQFISLRYGRNLIEGIGLVFNSGETVEGFSNPLWTILLSFFAQSENILAINRMLCILAALAHFPMLNLIMCKYTSANRPVVLQMLPSMLLALSMPFLFWAKSGMETVMVSLLFTAGFGLTVSGRYFSGSILLGLLGITRPEGVIYLLTAPVALRFGIDGSKKTFADYAKLLGPGLAIIAAYGVFRLSYYSAIVPNSFYAKVTLTSINQKFEGISYYLEWLLLRRGVGLVAALLLLTRDKELMKSAAPWVAGLMANGFFVVLVGGDYMPLQRFIVPVFSAVALTIGLGVMSLFPEERQVDSKLKGLTGLLILSAAVTFHPDTGKQIKAARYALTRPSDLPVKALTLDQRWKELWKTRLKQPNRFVGEWVRDNIEPDRVIALEECGIIPYVSKAKVVDLFGLMTPEIAKTPRPERPELLMKMDVEYILLAFHPEPPFPFYLEKLTEMEDFQARYCTKTFFASQNYRRGYPGFVLFERKDIAGDKCISPPSMHTDEEIGEWLSNALKDGPQLVTWDYSYDIFR